MVSVEEFYHRVAFLVRANVVLEWKRTERICDIGTVSAVQWQAKLSRRGTLSTSVGILTLLDWEKN